MASADIFQGEQNQHFVYHFQVPNDAIQMDVHKTVHPFCPLPSCHE